MKNIQKNKILKWKNQHIFHNIKIRKGPIDSVHRKYKHYYPWVFWEECKYVTDDTEISPDDSDRENSDEENSNKEN